MRITKLELLGVAVAGTLLGVGCTRPPTIDEVADATAEAASAVYSEGGRTSRAASQMDSVSLLSSGVSSVVNARAASLPPGVLPRDFELQLAPRTSDADVSDTKAILDRLAIPGVTDLSIASAQQSLSAEEDPQASYDAQGEKAAKFLRERIFTQENLEEKTGDALIFRITGEDVCTDGTVAPDPSCVASFDRYELRLKATRPDKGIDVTLLVGPQRYAPVQVKLAQDALAVRVELAQTRLAYVYFYESSGSTVGTPAGLPRIMEGLVEMSATKHGDHDYTLATAVLQAVRIESDTANGPITFQTAVKNPLASTRFIGPEQRLIMMMDLGQTDIGYPYRSYLSTGTAGQQIQIHLAGFSYSFDTQQGAQEILVNEIGLGDEQTYLAIDGRMLYTVDLNTASGRHLDLRVSRDADGRPVVKVSPDYDLALGLYFQTLGSDVSMGAWASEEHLHVSLTGEGGPIVQDVPPNTETGFPGALKIVSGMLRLEADEPGVAPVVVEAGQCLVRVAATTPDPHPFSLYAAQACP